MPIYQIEGGNGTFADGTEHRVARTFGRVPNERAHARQAGLAGRAAPEFSTALGEHRKRHFVDHDADVLAAIDAHQHARSDTGRFLGVARGGGHGHEVPECSFKLHTVHECTLRSRQQLLQNSGDKR